MHGAFDMGNIFGGASKRDTAGFAPLTAQEDHYTDSEDDLLGDRKKLIVKH